MLRNSTDSPFHPTTGTRTTLNARWTGAWLGGDVGVQRYEGEFAWYQSLAWKFVLMLDQTLGKVDGYGGRSFPTMGFRLGGNRRFGLRGYDFYEVVPRGNDSFTGGRFYHSIAREWPGAPECYSTSSTSATRGTASRAPTSGMVQPKVWAKPSSVLATVLGEDVAPALEVSVVGRPAPSTSNDPRGMGVAWQTSRHISL
jgi:hypothetical protein